MNNKFVILVLSLFVFSGSYAQNHYVEVTVSDTILAKADQFVYRLNFSTDMATMPIDTAAAKLPNYYLKRTEELREKQKQLKEDWQKKIKDAGFSIVPPNLNDAFIKNNYDNNTSTQVFINSIDSLTLFYSLIKNEKSLIGMVQSVKTKNEEYYFNNLYKRLLEKARKRAAFIAATIGKRISGIISVTENRGYFTGWNEYPQSYILQPPPYPFVAGLTATYQIQGNLTVKFLVK